VPDVTKDFSAKIVDGGKDTSGDNLPLDLGEFLRFGYQGPRTGKEFRGGNTRNHESMFKNHR
jgi:hypothetical protein